MHGQIAKVRKLNQNGGPTVRRIVTFHLNGMDEIFMCWPVAEKGLKKVGPHFLVIDHDRLVKCWCEELVPFPTYEAA